MPVTVDVSTGLVVPVDHKVVWDGRNPVTKIFATIARVMKTLLAVSKGSTCGGERRQRTSTRSHSRKAKTQILLCYIHKS